MKKFFFLIIALLVLSPSFCQVSKDLALEKKREAVDLMDNGNPDLAISLTTTGFSAKATRKASNHGKKQIQKPGISLLNGSMPMD
jgi:hypothetical protein